MDVYIQQSKKLSNLNANETAGIVRLDGTASQAQADRMISILI